MIPDLFGAMVDLGRNDFYYYCRFRMPRIYTDDKPHLKRLCYALQEFWESDRKRLIINMPPRHGKTLSVELLVEWVLGGSPDVATMVACYNESLSSRFSKAVRSGISERQASLTKPVFSDYFPGVKIKDGDAAMQLWALDGHHFSFLATSPGGTATGLGAQLLVIDDLIKNAEEANNPRILDEHWSWYCDTVLSRIESGGKQIVIQTRWATKDLSGRLLDLEPEKWDLILMPAQADDGTMLCDDILDRAEYEDRKLKTDPVIIAGNYQQSPYDSVDKLYGEFKTYTELPVGGMVEAYVDTADEGSDFLACAVYRLHKNTAYIMDIVYTQEPMEITENAVAKSLTTNRCQTAWIESNNGGRGFSRNVERIMREVLAYTGCRVSWFHQSDNKTARILSNSTNVVNMVVMPSGWEAKWPRFAQDIRAMARGARWKHDDAADMLTGIIEKSANRKEPRGAVEVIPVKNNW